MRSFASPAVAAVFAGYAPEVRAPLLHLREMIFDVAACTPGVGPLEETLKWGQPSYRTAETGSGSPVRLGALRAPAEGYALYFHCQTTLVDSFRKRFGAKFRYEGNRALLFPGIHRVPVTQVRQCIAAALTYHLDKGERVRVGRPARCQTKKSMAHAGTWR